MAQLVPVSDPADPRLADYVRLRDVNLRKSLEAEHGLFIAEGEKVIRRAIGTGHPVRSLLMARRWAEPLADLLDTLDAPVYIADDATLEQVAGFQVHRGALASMRRLPLASVEERLAGARRVLVLEDLVDHANVDVAVQHTSPPRRILILEDLVDHGNVGAIYRCAAALGIDTIILSPRCADLNIIRAAGFKLLALTPDQSAIPLDKAPMSERVALMLGSEGDGLSSHWLDEADERVCIPMSLGAMANGVDSLNVVAAAAIACHGLMRS
jgi:tRNA G18 (ribose-2'-O)-methylase SpoU